MQFKSGTTRYVLCVGGVVIKIARIKVLYWAKRLLHFRDEGVLLKKVNTTKAAQKFAALKHLFCGVTANLEELRTYKNYPKLPLAPTLFSLFGFVNIQVRGAPIKANEMVACPFREIAGRHIDLGYPENFARVNGRLVLVDCGHNELNVLLAEYAESI
ncbi:MAG TPA: hypothetical protein VJC14_00380 [Candidatus Paceibacterota bacterium]